MKPALAPLEGTYRDDFRYEAYANYNAGKALAELGRCEKALAYLDRSQALQGSRSEIDEARDLPCHTGLVLVSERGKALGRVLPDKSVKVVRGDRDVFGLHGRSAEQRIALDLLTDPEVGIVSLGDFDALEFGPQVVAAAAQVSARLS